MKSIILLNIIILVFVSSCRDNVNRINEFDVQEAKELLSQPDLDIPINNDKSFLNKSFPLGSCVLVNERKALVVYSQEYTTPISREKRMVYVVKFDDDGSKDYFDESFLYNCD